MFNETLEIVKANHDVITAISGVVFGSGTLAIAIWIAYFSPQALQAKIEKKKYLLEKRKEHYARLDHEIFKPLSKSLFLRRDGLSASELDLLKIEFIPTIANQFENGIYHLNIDFPDFPTNFKKFREDVEKYNLSLEIFYQKLDFAIRTEFAEILELNDSYVFEHGFYILGIKPVKEVILVIFSRFLNKIPNYDKKLIQDVCKSAITSDIVNHGANVAFVGKRPFQIFGHSVTNFHFELPIDLNNPDEADEGIPQTFFETERSNELKKQLIVDHICAITSDEEAFKTYRQINSMREELLKTEKKISNEIKQISESINKGDYETVAQCCSDKKFL